MVDHHFAPPIWGRIVLVLVPGIEEKMFAKLSLNYQGENGYWVCIIVTCFWKFCSSSALISKGIYLINTHHIRCIWAWLLCTATIPRVPTQKPSHWPPIGWKKTKWVGFDVISTHISPLKHGSFNYIPILGGSNNANVWVVFRDFPCKSVLFGLVKSWTLVKPRCLEGSDEESCRYLKIPFLHPPGFHQHILQGVTGLLFGMIVQSSTNLSPIQRLY